MATMKRFSSKRDIRHALKVLLHRIEAYQSPLLQEEDLGYLQIKSAPMTFTTDGNYDPPFDLCFFQPLPLKLLHGHPINRNCKDTGPEARELGDEEICELSDFDPDEDVEDPYGWREPIHRARALEGYLNWELTGSLRQNIPKWSCLLGLSKWKLSK
jgi:hypothetical protein